MVVRGLQRLRPLVAITTRKTQPGRNMPLPTSSPSGWIVKNVGIKHKFPAVRGGCKFMLGSPYRNSLAAATSPWPVIGSTLQAGLKLRGGHVPHRGPRIMPAPESERSSLPSSTLKTTGSSRLASHQASAQKQEQASLADDPSEKDLGIKGRFKIMAKEYGKVRHQHDGLPHSVHRRPPHLHLQALHAKVAHCAPACQ